MVGQKMATHTYKQYDMYTGIKCLVISSNVIIHMNLYTRIISDKEEKQLNTRKLTLKSSKLKTSKKN